MAAFARTFILIAAATAVAAAFGVWHIAHNVCVARGIYLFCFVSLLLLLLSSVYMAGGVARCRLNEIT